MRSGETICWAGRSLSYFGLAQHDLPDKFVIEARLEVAEGAKAPYLLLPAENLSPAAKPMEVASCHSLRLERGFLRHSSRRQEWRPNPSHLDRKSAHGRWLWSAGWICLAGGITFSLWPPQRRKHPQITHILRR